MADDSEIRITIKALSKDFGKPLSDLEKMRQAMLTQAALALQNIITELRRKDGDDAWERL